jgi:uncharacterized protein (DUF2267 family)
MAHDGQLPGTPPGGPEPTLEWVNRGEGITGALRARLGSDSRDGAVVVAVLSCLRAWLERDTFDGLVDELPWPLRTALRSPEGLPRIPALAGRDGLVAAVGELAQRTPAQAAYLIRAVFATVRDQLARGLADAVERELPRDVADLWREAR